MLSVAGALAGSVAVVGPSVAATGRQMVALGDSVPSGARCSCRPFPERYADKVGAHTGEAVAMANDAVGGATSGDVLQQLDQAAVRRAVEASTTALVMIGANDFAPAFRRVLAHRARARVAFPRVADQVRQNVTGIVRRLRQLRPHLRVVVAGYWNVMKDGKVGLQTYGTWGEEKADQATTYANAALRDAVAATHATYVSTYRPFKGPQGHLDPTPLLAWDGDHPDRKGHEVIASAFYAAAPDG